MSDAPKTYRTRYPRRTTFFDSTPPRVFGVNARLPPGEFAKEKRTEMRNIIISFIAVGGAVFFDFFVADLSAATAIALALTGLMAAATKGDVKEIRRLLKNGENPNQTDEDSWTALIRAAGRGHSEATKVLLDKRRRSESGRQRRLDGFDVHGCWTFQSHQSFARQRRKTESSSRKRLDGFDQRGF